MDGYGRGLAGMALALAVLVLVWPAVRWAWGIWWSDPLYSHGPLVVLVSLVIAWRVKSFRLSVEAEADGDRPESARPSLPRHEVHFRRGIGDVGAGEEGGTTWSLAIVAISLAMMVWSLSARAWYLTLLLLPVWITGTVGFLYGGIVLRRYAFPTWYLLFAIPLPFVERLSVPLQRWAVGASTAVARLLGVPASHEGSKVLLPSCELSVGAPCSGVRSLVALLALATLMAYLLAGHWWARVSPVVAAAPLALLLNAGRLLALLLIAARWGREAALGVWHKWSGPLSFGLAVVLLIALSRWVGCRGVRDDI